MIQNNKTNDTKEKPAFDLKPMTELKGFDFGESDAMVCDMETGICGPVDKEKEKK